MLPPAGRGTERMMPARTRWRTVSTDRPSSAAAWATVRYAGAPLRGLTEWPPIVDNFPARTLDTITDIGYGIGVLGSPGGSPKGGQW